MTRRPISRGSPKSAILFVSMIQLGGATPNDQDSNVEVIEDDEIDQELANKLAEVRFEKTSGKKLARKLLLPPFLS